MLCTNGCHFVQGSFGVTWVMLSHLIVTLRQLLDLTVVSYLNIFSTMYEGQHATLANPTSPPQGLW